MVFFGFTIGGAILSHSIRLHIEASNINKWFNYFIEYDESANGFRIILDLLKIQMYFSILSNCQDFWFNDSVNMENYNSNVYMEGEEEN